MKRLILTLSIFFILIFSAQAQRPNVPGDLVVDFGLSLLSNAPENMDLRAFGSRGVNVYYLYHIGLGEESNFSINPGIGLGMENYNFKNSVTLDYTSADGNEIVDINDYFDEVTLEDLRKTKLSVNYIDIPLEFRFHANKENHDRGFM
ncbi:MAG: outer membrane beta-barrel protein, partial [Cyclobacteriaceae bacterium]